MAGHKACCRHCGFVWTVAAEFKDRTDLLCISCRAKPAKVVQYGKLRCEPHSGRFDADDNPIDDFGDLVLPGVRICGHRDCVNTKHVERDI